MADDIDDLLDEVESKFCGSEKKQRNNKNSKAQAKPKINEKSSTSGSLGLDNDLSDAMRDILDEDNFGLDSNKVSKKPVVAQNSIGVKCFPIMLSGTSKSSFSASTRICDRLHCTTCDNKVVSFENFDWHSTCDYLFFRNNYPDFSKLKGKLVPCQGSRAYCCQCCWVAVRQASKLEDCSSFKWICKRH